MSHGCSSDDFVSIIGKPLPEVKCDLPIMFLLENPGGDCGNGKAVTCDGVTKNPPVNHFYFSSELDHWPTTPDEIKNPYGDYFAYLMAKFGLANVYVTNCVKCEYSGDKKDPNGRYLKTAWNCMVRFLEKEIELFQPRLIVCFGRQVSDELLYKKIECSGKPLGVPFVKSPKPLLHPSTPFNPYHRKKWPWAKFVQENDRRLQKALDSLP